MEGSPIPVADKPNPHVSVEFEKKDLSIGTARYRGAKRISKNLSMKPTLPSLPDNPIPHANVEVHLFDDQGNEVPMTRRLVRYWKIKPLPGATVNDLSKWHIVGLENPEFSPFSPFAAAGELPDEMNFEWDRPSAKDSPGLQGRSVNDEPDGRLQEFLVGNKKVGGAYYQIYTLTDTCKTRVISTRELTLSVTEYGEALQSIDSGDYSRMMSRKLFFMPRGKESHITPYPKPSCGIIPEPTR